MNEYKRLEDTDLYENLFHYKENRSNRRFFTALLLVFFVLFVLVGAWRMRFGGVEVSGSSMENTFHNGDYLLMQHYRDGDELEYGSVIVVNIGEYEEVQAYNAEQRKKNPNWVDTTIIIKRLIAKEGDTVRCKNGKVEVRYAGQTSYTTLSEPYAKYSNPQNYDFKTEYVVGEGEIFFLGDNREVSMDSRYNEGYSHLSGLYKQSDIYGIVPQWAIEHKETLEKIFFWRNKLERIR